MRGVVISEQGSIQAATFDGVDDMRKAVGGNVVMYPCADYSRPVTAFVHEECKLRGMAHNPFARALLWEVFDFTMPLEPMTGPVIIVGPDGGSLSAQDHGVQAGVWCVALSVVNKPTSIL